MRTGKIDMEESGMKMMIYAVKKEERLEFTMNG